jgi:GT2 family glycosyltransferase
MTLETGDRVEPTVSGGRPGGEATRRLAVCIPTWRRAHLLARLVADLGRQTRRIDRIVVVDGDPDSGAVRDILPVAARTVSAELVYVPSNHGNISYQRYLGWRAAEGCDVILYLDDDLRIRQADAVDLVVAPLLVEGSDVVGVTARIRFSDGPASDDPAAPLDSAELTRGGRKPRIVRWLGSSRSVRPGGLTPTGHRRMPVDAGEGYSEVDWLHGGVMGYRTEAITRQSFSDDVFALYHVRYGKGEDTFLSRRAGERGRLLYAHCATFDHPSESAPTAYPTGAFRLGHAAAYSRRLHNDHYRAPAPPTLGDRVALVRTYVGTTLVNLARAIRSPRKQRFAYAAGYGVGAARGLATPPSAPRLTPGIDWWGDADAALARAGRIERLS